VAQPSMVPHSVLKRHMDQAKDRRASRHREEEERHGERDHFSEKLPRLVQLRLPSAKRQHARASLEERF
jgi:hypothetical protein